jgi:hypothetical protein
VDTENLFQDAWLAYTVGNFEEAQTLLRVVKSQAQASGDTHAAARAYLTLIGVQRAKGDRRAEGAELRALERAALMFPGSPLEAAIQAATAQPLKDPASLQAALDDLRGGD